MKIAIIGLGAIGLDFSNKLISSGISLTGFTRKPVGSYKVFEKNKSSKLIIESYNRPRSEDLGCYDLIVFALKNQILVRTLSIYLPLLKKDGYVLCLQNGIMEYFIAEHFPVNRLLGAVAAGNSIYNPPDTVNISHPVAYTIGAFNSFHNADRTYTDLIEIFSKVPRVKIVPNILSAKWKKLLFSSILNPLSAICGATADKILKNDIAVEVGLKIIDEILQVADCEGVEISKSKLFSPYILKSNNQIPHIIKHGLLHLLAPAIKGMVISMLQDIEAGRETEIDYINGMVKRLADTHNISVPFNVLTIQIVKEIEEKKVLPSFNNLERYRKLLDTV